MPSIEQKKITNAPIDKVFNLIKNFSDYPKFLPWCSGSRIHSYETHGHIEIFVADLIISYKGFSESFTTKVVCDNNEYSIDISYLKGPFKHLKSKWSLKDLGQEKTEISFMIDFEFSNFIFQKIIGFFFEEAMKRMITAFEERLLVT